MAKHQRDLAKERFWRQMIQLQRGSGLNAREFCQQRELSESSFYAWRRELQRRDQQAAVSPTTTRSAKRRESNSNKRSAAQAIESASLVEVVTRSSRASSSVEIETPGGYTIRLQGPIDRDSLATLLDVLSAHARSSC